MNTPSLKVNREIASSEYQALLLSLAILGVVALVGFLSRPLLPIDETRYVGVAWEMWLRGDFLVPFKNGETYSHKPPLMMWLFHLGWAIFGVNEWWPRLVSPLASAGSLLLVFGLARRLWPQQRAVASTASLILISCSLWLIFSTLAMFDVLLAFFVLSAMHGVLQISEGRTKSGIALLGISLGLGVLEKGPVVLLHVFPAALLAPWWNPGLRWLRWYGSVFTALFLGVTVALAWAVPAGIAGGDAFRGAIFWGQTANRVVDSFAHRRPIWWYLPLLPAFLFPWFVWPEMWRAVKRFRERGIDRGGRFCIAWMLPVLLAFSMISGKQPHYLIPAIPAFALFASRAMSDEEPGRGIRLPSMLVLFVGVSLSFMALTGRTGGMQGVPEFLPGFLLALVGGFGVIAGRYIRKQIVVLAMIGPLVMMCGHWAVMPALAPAYDVQTIAKAIGKVQDRGGKIAHQGTYYDQYHFAGRLRLPLVEISGADALVKWLKNQADGYAVLYGDRLDQFDKYSAIAAQPYRGKIAVLLDARSALKYLTQSEQ